MQCVSQHYQSVDAMTFLIGFLLNGVLFVMILVPDVATQQGTTQFRLVGSGRANAGRLEVLHNGVWGTVCADLFEDASAIVACNSLGFGYVGVSLGNRYGAGNGTIWMDNVECIGTELSLDLCSFTGWNDSDCGHDEDISISCVPLNVRLANSTLSDEGRLEVYYNDAWGTVCDDGFDDTAARVACFMLGFGYVGRVINNTYGSGSGQIWLDEVRCSGSETSLATCRHNTWGSTDCSHSEDVSISCSLRSSSSAAKTTTAASSTRQATTTSTIIQTPTATSTTAPTAVPTAFSSDSGDACIKRADIVLLLDQSTSLVLRPDVTVDYDQWNVHLLNFVNDFIDQFRVHPSWTRIGLMLFNDTTEVVFNLSYNRTEMHQKLDQVRKKGIQGGDTNIAKALLTAREMFTAERGARNETSKIVVLITDGNPQDINRTVMEANRMKNEGIEIYCVELPPSDSVSGRNEMAQIASRPLDSHVLNGSSYDTLRTDVLPRLVDYICGKPESLLCGQKGPVRPGVIGGIVAGIVVVLFLIVVAVVLTLNKKKKEGKGVWEPAAANTTENTYDFSNPIYEYKDLYNTTEYNSQLVTGNTTVGTSQQSTTMTGVDYDRLDASPVYNVNNTHHPIGNELTLNVLYDNDYDLYDRIAD